MKKSKNQVQNSRLLIVDDLTTVRKTLLSHLSDLGYCNYIEVTNSERAIDLLREQHFDVLITDCDVRGVDGIDLIERVRSNIDTAALPLLMLTSERQMRDAKDKSNQYVSKPLSKAVLGQKLKNALASYSESLSTGL